MGDRGKLGKFLKEVINWRWDEFCRAEKDEKYSGIEAVVFSLVRTTAEGKLGAIRLALDRVDGKVETPVQIVYPKIYYIYPNAKSVAGLPAGDVPPAIQEEELVSQIEEDDTSDPVTLTLRETLGKMAESPRTVVPFVLGRKRQTEEAIRQKQEIENAPYVKSVIAANLLNLADKNFDAITEVFDQIDGKLVETIKVLGDDIYLTQYAAEAPAGAYVNKDGIYIIEAAGVEEIWKNKFKQGLSSS